MLVYHPEPFSVTAFIPLILSLCSLLVAIFALGAPALIWFWQRWATRPILKASYLHEQPMARMSSRWLKTPAGLVPLGEPLYDFHFHLRNIGKSTAENVTATVVEFWYEDRSGDLVQLEGFLPVPLRYQESETVDIHPQRPYYWNVGYLPSHKALKKLPVPPRFNAPGKQSTGLAFWLDLEGAPWYQVNALAKGNYGIKIILHSKNAATERIFLKIYWTGQFRITEAAMFKKIRIEHVHKLP